MFDISTVMLILRHLRHLHALPQKSHKPPSLGPAHILLVQLYIVQTHAQTLLPQYLDINWITVTTWKPYIWCTVYFQFIVETHAQTLLPQYLGMYRIITVRKPTLHLMYCVFSVYRRNACPDLAAAVPRYVPHHSERHGNLPYRHEKCVQSQVEYPQKVRSQGKSFKCFAK